MTIFQEFLWLAKERCGKKIKNGEYSWLKLNLDKNKKLSRLIDIYAEFDDVVESVKFLNRKVDRLKQLKNAPDDAPIEEEDEEEDEEEEDK